MLLGPIPSNSTFPSHYRHLYLKMLKIVFVIVNLRIFVTYRRIQAFKALLLLDKFDKNFRIFKGELKLARKTWKLTLHPLGLYDSGLKISV